MVELGFVTDTGGGESYEEELDDIFTSLDPDGSGEIEYRELQSLLRASKSRDKRATTIAVQSPRLLLKEVTVTLTLTGGATVSHVVVQ